MIFARISHLPSWAFTITNTLVRDTESHQTQLPERLVQDDDDDDDDDDDVDDNDDNDNNNDKDNHDDDDDRVTYIIFSFHL